MATKKVKKFGRGGDILTGLGAGLAAYGAYKHFFGDKDKEQTSTGRDVSEPPPQDRGRKGEDLIRDAIEGKKGDKTDSGRNSNRSPVEEHAYITQGGSDGGSSDNTPVSTNDKKPKNQKQNQNQNQNQNRNQNQNQNRNQGAITTTGVDAGIRAGNQKSKPYPVQSRPNEDRKPKPYPSQRVIAENKRKRENLEKGAGLTPYAPYTGPGSSSHAQMLRDSRDPEKVKQRLAETKRRDEETARKRKGAADINYDISGNVINKRGGVIRKFAAGGTVKRSASSRADGIAIRGKTRA